MKVSFVLKDADLEYFRQAIKKAQRLVSVADDEDIIHAAETVIKDIFNENIPEFVKSRVTLLQLMTRMVRDEDWILASKERNRVLCALAYFADPEDIIPDNIPGIGFLDDAIMIELVFRELHHELDAYRDFCSYREEFNIKYPDASREKRVWKLGNRREALHERILRRRKKELLERNKSIAPIW